MRYLWGFGSIIALFASGLLVALAAANWEFLTQAFRVGVVVVGVLAAAGLLVGLIAGVVWLVARAMGQYYQVQEQKTRLEHAKTQIEFAPPGYQAYARVVGGSHVSVVPTHLFPAGHNGSYGGEEPPPWLLEMYRLHTEANAKRPGHNLTVEGRATLAAGDDPRAALNLVDTLARTHRLMIQGASGSGKSSLVRHVVARKLDLVDQLVLCDPHGSRPKWGAAVDAVGFGDDVEAIINTLAGLEVEYARRLQLLTTGERREREFPVICLVIEELPSIADFCREGKIDLGHYIRLFLNKTRKTAIDLILVSQESTVEAVALKGRGQALESVSRAFTLGRDGVGHRVRYVAEDGSTIEVEPPPLWPDSLPVGVDSSKLLRLPAPQSDEERAIVEVIVQNRGASYSELAGLLGRSRSGHTNRLIQAAIAKFGLEFCEIGGEMSVK
jgi:hypothetical protein